MCLQASIIPQCKINSLVPRAPLVHHLEQHQQKKFRAIPQKSQELGSVREESEIQAPTPKRAHTWSVTAIFLSLRQKNPDGKVQQFPQQVSFLANQIKQIHIKIYIERESRSPGHTHPPCPSLQASGSTGKRERWPGCKADRPKEARIFLLQIQPIFLPLPSLRAEQSCSSWWFPIQLLSPEAQQPHRKRKKCCCHPSPHHKIC